MSVWARALLFHLKEQIIKYYFKSNLGCKYANRFVILDYECLGEERIFRKKALIAELKKKIPCRVEHQFLDIESFLSTH